MAELTYVLTYLLTSVVLSVVQILVLVGLYCLKCTKFDQLILRKIIKIVATRCQILTLKCTKFDFGSGSSPHPAGRTYSAPQTPKLDLRGLLLRGGEVALDLSASSF